MNCPLCDKPTTSGGTTFFLTYGKCHNECMKKNIEKAANIMKGVAMSKPAFYPTQEVAISARGVIKEVAYVMMPNGKVDFRYFVKYEYPDHTESDLIWVREASLTPYEQPQDFIGGTD